MQCPTDGTTLVMSERSGIEIDSAKSLLSSRAHGMAGDMVGAAVVQFARQQEIFGEVRSLREAAHQHRPQSFRVNMQGADHAGGQSGGAYCGG